jgi:nucleotide-binding universal stress UspA family protein
MTFEYPFARIVVGYDASPAGETALGQAIALAEQCHGEVVVVHVSEFPAAAVLPLASAAPARFDPAPLLSSLEPYRHDLFDRVRERVAACSVPVSMEFVMNAAAAGILDAALRWSATAIVVGTHARAGLARAFAGSVAEEVVRAASLPVVVSREGAPAAPIGRLVVGIDVADPSANAIAFALAFGRAHAARLLYCTVTDTASILSSGADLPFDPTPFLSEMRISARNALDAALQDANGEGVYPDTEITDAVDAGVALCQVARRHETGAIVVGNHKRGYLERFFLGSTAEAVIHAADQPVIVVPADAPVVPTPARQPV